jgi:cobalt-zinc-cadmium efflux system outer membrane protein
MTLGDFESLALRQNPTLNQAVSQVGISQGKALQAGLYPNPMVGYTAEQIGAGGTAGELHGLFVQQEIVTAGKLQLSRRKYQQEAAQAQAQIDAQQYRVLSTVRKAFYHALMRQRQVEVRQELLQNAEDGLTTTRQLVNVGQANRPDLLQAELQARRIKAELGAAERRFAGDWNQLAAVSGNPTLPPGKLSGQLEVADSEVLSREAMLAELLTCSPQIRVAWTEVARDQIAVARECVEPIPNVQLRAESGYNFETQNSVAGVSVGFKLPIFDRNQGSVMQAQAELARAQEDVRRIELVLHRKLGDKFSDYEAALQTAKAFQEEVLPKAKEAYESYLDAFQNRRAAWPQVLVAQREYFQLTDEYLETLNELRQSEAELKGLFLGDGLEQPPAPPPQGHREATPRPR